GCLDARPGRSELEPGAFGFRAAVSVLRFCVSHAVVPLPRISFGIPENLAIADQPTGGGDSRLCAVDWAGSPAGLRHGLGLRVESGSAAVSCGRLPVLSDVC